jgi:hypothetical protein
LEEERDFLFSKTMHTGSGAHPASYSMGISVLHPGVKQLGCEVDQLLLPRPKLKIMELYLYSPYTSLWHK